MCGGRVVEGGNWEWCVVVSGGCGCGVDGVMEWVDGSV